MRRAAKVDANQPEIVEAFRKLGWSVRCTHQIGQGFPDLAVGKKGFTTLIEIKATSRDRLTVDEESFWSGWLGSLVLITSVDEVIELDRKRFGRK